MGALQMAEMINITTNDIERHGEKLLLVKVPISKNKEKKSFTIQGTYLELIEQDIALRLKEVKTDRFFLNYQNDKVTSQPIAIYKIRKMPMIIAKYLNLLDPEKYTGKELTLISL